jgi:DNA helicase-2/ATP-dependent DNA helicase PcrA
LEFPVVFIAGLSESMFPAKKTSSVESMEEERRLFFVALTRAKDLLYLSDAEGFTKEAQYRHISRFVFDIDKSLLRYSKDLTDEQIKESLSYIEYENSRLEKMSALSKVVVGSHVKHAILGKGVVESIDEERKRYVIRFEKLSTTRELSFKAPLELL